MTLGEPDASGRRSPVRIPGSEFVNEYDNIIAGIGQKSAIPEGYALEVQQGNIIANGKTLETSKKGVFAGGDVVTGPATVIDAVAAGRRAAESIVHYLKNEDLDQNKYFSDTVRPLSKDSLPLSAMAEKKQRSVPLHASLNNGSDSFMELEGGFTEEQALKEAGRCLNCALCAECQECVRVCEQQAIDHSMSERMVKLNVGAVILSTGFQEFAAEKKGEFGFGRYPNVLTSVQFERMLSASGPFEGNIVRRSDGREARRLAWIQCVGSRDIRCGHEYCSSVCCMASTKQALIAADHMKGMEASIFYMDIRAYGKDFDQYYERARKKENIQYIRSIPSRILQLPESKDLRLKYMDTDGRIVERDFDLVILSVGMEPSSSAIEGSRKIGIELNEYGFCKTDRFDPISTSRKGVFVAGVFQEPKDIPETVTQASAASAKAMTLLAPARYSLVSKKKYPVEHDVTDEKPRIGVFICHCGKNVASVVDVEKVAGEAAQLSDVVYATHTMYACADSSLETLRDIIHTHRLNRIVVASCTPRTHEPIFRETLREAGLNPYLFELTNIRDQCSWVHSAEPEKATLKAIELTRMAVARARHLSPLSGTSSSVNQTGLVIGGGVSGMTAALALAEQGFKVHLVEKTSCLGGNALTLNYTLEHDDIVGFISELKRKVTDHENIYLHLSTEVAAVSGFIGSFKAKLINSRHESVEDCGAIIVATGAVAADTEEYLRGNSDRIMLQLELEEKLAAGTFVAGGKNIVMIQCAGSRDDTSPYCSRICCSMAIKNALRIKKQNSAASVYVLYRDIRAYGFREKYYREARQAGIIFIRYEKSKPPQVSLENGLFVRIKSPDFSEDIEIASDYIVLSTGIKATSDNRKVANMLKVAVNSDGFFNEAHLKLRPVDFATEGIFLCGLAHSPKFMDENISQSYAAAARAATVLSRTTRCSNGTHD